MIDIETLKLRNAEFASTYTNDLTIMPKFSTIVLSCIDARVDPAQILGIDAGDALVMRTGGGRVSDDLILELAILSGMVRRMRGDAFKGFSLAVIHHTDCGFERLANPEIAAGLSNGLGIEPAKLEALAIREHSQSLAADVDKLKNSPNTPKDLKVGGYLFDVSTGLIDEVIPMQPIS